MLTIILSETADVAISEAIKQKNIQKVTAPLEYLSLGYDLFSKGRDVSMFGETYAYFINAKEGGLEYLAKENLNDLVSSPHHFYIFGKGVNFKKRIDDIGIEFSKNNNFKLLNLIKFVKPKFPDDFVEAIQKKDKRAAWPLFHREKKISDSEKLHGLCTYSLKTLMLVNSMNVHDEKSGVHPFVFQKTKRLGIQRDKEEIVNCYYELIDALDRAREGEGDLYSNIETWILGW